MNTTRRCAAIVPAVLLTVVALSACGTAQKEKEAAPATSSTAAPSTSATAAKPAGSKVAPADLPAIVANRTYRGDSEGKPYAEYYAPDGTLRGKTDGKSYAGTWKVVGEQLCFDYPKEGSTSETDCYAVFKNGDALSWVTADGKIVATTFVEGNPDNL